VTQFTVRCANGEILGEDDIGQVWPDVRDADQTAVTWDSDCGCNGPHEVLVRTITTSAWEPLDG
jgi:hypothetical protein